MRSTLEYATKICDPYYVCDIDSLKQNQWRTAHLTNEDYNTTSNVIAMLAELGRSTWRTAGEIYG